MASLVMTVCRILRFLLNWDDKKSESKGGIIGAVIVMCLKWFLDAILQLVQYISDKALVVCSVHGTDFWNSVKRISKLFVKDILLVVAVENVIILYLLT